MYSAPFEFNSIFNVPSSKDSGKGFSSLDMCLEQLGLNNSTSPEEASLFENSFPFAQYSTEPESSFASRKSSPQQQFSNSYSLWGTDNTFTLFPSFADEPIGIIQTSSKKITSHPSYIIGNPIQSQPIDIPMKPETSSYDKDINYNYDENSESKFQQGKSDLAESPNSKLQFKQFYKTFKAKEKDGFEDAKSFALEYVSTVPEHIHWKIYLEMADLAKRENRISEARQFYNIVNTVQPLASQGWLEHAKMEEECGDLMECQNILKKGLEYCPSNESLMVKCLKHYERMDRLDEARSLLGMLKGIPAERTWRTIMEGGLLEARQGNIQVARSVFKYLVKSVPWYGPIYLEACRFEERCEENVRAMNFVEKGLQENPRYGPLWFSALRLYEKLHNKSAVLSKISETIDKAIRSISKELVWKLYFEGAQILERACDLAQARVFYVNAVQQCPSNLLWKVWLGGAKTELNQGNISVSRKLLKRALKEVPTKMKPMVLLECSRLEEYARKYSKARLILANAKKSTKHEWKVFLESILLEIRSNNLPNAITEAKEALKIHSGTGRLWAILIQLKQYETPEKQISVFKRALNEVPKSGEVWCEGARIALQLGNFTSARQYINFAIQFTPQYGDSFIEYLRLELLENGENANIAKVEQACVNADPNYGALWLYFKRHPLDSTRQVLRYALEVLTKPTDDGVGLLKHLSVNNIYKNIHEKSDEERRKAIFL